MHAEGVLRAKPDGLRVAIWRSHIAKLRFASEALQAKLVKLRLASLETKSLAKLGPTAQRAVGPVSPKAKPV